MQSLWSTCGCLRSIYHKPNRFSPTLPLSLPNRNHKDSDDDEEYDEEEDEKEFWYEDGKLAGDNDTGVVGGEWVDSNDLAQVIAVDRERIAAGGYYTNFVDEP